MLKRFYAYIKCLKSSQTILFNRLLSQFLSEGVAILVTLTNRSDKEPSFLGLPLQGRLGPRSQKCTQDGILANYISIICEREIKTLELSHGDGYSIIFL